MGATNPAKAAAQKAAAEAAARQAIVKVKKVAKAKIDAIAAEAQKEAQAQEENVEASTKDGGKSAQKDANKQDAVNKILAQADMALVTEHSEVHPVPELSKADRHHKSQKQRDGTHQHPRI